jgi:hypothetical protein
VWTAVVTSYWQAAVLVLASLSVLESEALYRLLLTNGTSQLGIAVLTEIKLHRLFARERFR